MVSRVTWVNSANRCRAFSCAAALAHVAHDSLDRRSAIVNAGGAGHLDVDRPAVQSQQLLFHHWGGLAFLHLPRAAADPREKTWMHEVDVRLSNQLLPVGGPKQPHAGIVDVGNRAIVRDQDRVGRMLHQATVALFTLTHGLFHRTLFVAESLFFQGIVNRRDQPGIAILDQVIVRPLLHATDGVFFANRAGDDDKRDVELPLAQQFQGPEGVELRQAVIGQNHLGQVGPLQFADVMCLGVDPSPDKSQSTAAQLAQNQLQIIGAVFDDQQAHFRRALGRDAAGVGGLSDHWLLLGARPPVDSFQDAVEQLVHALGVSADQRQDRAGPPNPAWGQNPLPKRRRSRR